MKHYTLLFIWVLFCGCTAQADIPCQWVQVKKVVDGDTLKLEDGRWVRCAAIDTPEIDHRNNRADPLAYEARDFLRHAVSGRSVCLVTGRVEEDHYGRIVAYLFDKKGKFINEDLVAHGLAHVYPHKDEIKAYAEKLLAAQQQAMHQRKGIWQHRLDTAGSFIGNRRSKRFHQKTCPSGRRIKHKNRRAFASIWDAYWSGYAPAADCM